MDAFLEKPDRRREPNGPNGEGDERDERDEVADDRDARGTERRTRDGFGVNPIVA
jgi:hypothetical protein